MIVKCQHHNTDVGITYIMMDPVTRDLSIGIEPCTKCLECACSAGYDEGFEAAKPKEKLSEND